MQAFFRWLAAPIAYLVFLRARLARQTTLLWTLAVAVDRKVALVPFLEALADEAGGSWKHKLHRLADLLHSGMSVPDALDAVPGILPADALVLVRVGAETGRLGPTLREAAAQFARQSETVRNPGGAGILYLCGLAFVMCNIVGFIMYWIIPKFLAIFDGFDMDLPEHTQTVIQIGHFVTRNAFAVIPSGLLVLLAGIAVAFQLLGRGVGWTDWSGWTARLFPRWRMPVVLRSLGVAVDGHCPLERAVGTLATRHPDSAFRERMTRVEQDLSQGVDCWRSLESHGLLRHGETALLEAAQRVGNLGWALRSVADTLERRTDHRLRVTIEFLRPAALLAAGAVVGFFVFAMFSPLISLLKGMPIDEVVK